MKVYRFYQAYFDVVLGLMAMVMALGFLLIPVMAWGQLSIASLVLVVPLLMVGAELMVAYPSKIVATAFTVEVHYCFRIKQVLFWEDIREVRVIAEGGVPHALVFAETSNTFNKVMGLLTVLRPITIFRVGRAMEGYEEFIEETVRLSKAAVTYRICYD